MLRRSILLALASTLWLSACSPAVPSKISISQAQLLEGLQQHFPKRYPIAGLLQLEMLQPQLQLLAATNQLQTQVQVQLSGPALRETFNGQMDMRFSLRFEPRDRTVRAYRVEVLSLELMGANPAVSDMVSTYGPRIASQALEEFALYTVKAQDMQLADSLGLRPGAITVTEQGLDVAIESNTPTAKATP